MILYQTSPLIIPGSWIVAYSFIVISHTPFTTPTSIIGILNGTTKANKVAMLT